MRLRNGMRQLVTLMLVLSLIGCTSANDGANNADRDTGGQLRVAINAQPPTIDPHMSTADLTKDVARQMFETLVTINSNFQPQPMLAESYETSDDGKTITFHLRQGVKFHNGKEMLAEDVVASMNRWKELSSKAKAAFGDGVFEAEDDYTVLLKLNDPSGIALSLLASPTQFPAIMPKEVVESAGEEEVEEYIGTGPFAFEELRHDQYIKLKKYDDYQSLSTPSDGAAGEKAALVDELSFIITSDASTRIAGIQTGEYDIAMQIPIDNLEQLESDPNVEAVSFQSGYNALIFNNKEGLFADEKMRQAVAAALDLEPILRAMHSDEQFYRLDHGLMQVEQTDWYSEAGNEHYNQNDPEKAKQLLQEAGYGGEPFRLLTTREYEEYYNASVVIQEQLEQIGMPVELEIYDWATVVERRKDPTAYDAFITGFSISVDPTQILYLDSRNEWDGWTNNAEIDGLLDQIRMSQSQEQSQELFAQLQAEFWRSVPVIKFGDKNTLHITSKDVEGYQYVDGMLLWNVKNTK